MGRKRRWSLWGGLACLLAAMPVARAEGPGDEARITHLTTRTLAEVGRSRIVAFRLPEAAETDLTLDASVSEPDVLEIVRRPTVGAGETVGYVRVLGLAPGRAVLDVADQPIEVEVVPIRVDLDSERFAPRIVGPTDGAAVWGTVGVGIEVRQTGGDLRDVVIRLPDGGWLDPREDSGPRHQPYRQLYFELDASAYDPGPLVLTPVASDWEGREQVGPAVRLRIIDPPADRVYATEAETRHEVERPRRFQDARLQIGRDRQASGGSFFNNAGAYPAVCFPLDVEADGWYQAMIVAAGTPAQGALPTVGMVIDGQNFPVTNGRLLTRNWHRFAAGVPFRLEAGRRIVTPFYENDFFAADMADRNLYLDRIEIVRVADTASRAAGADMMMMAMTGDAMQTDLNDLGDVVIEDHYGRVSSPLWIAFSRPLDGQVIPGVLEVEGRCWWAGVEERPAPVVTLVVNGEAILTQRSGAPRFWVDPSCFEPGANTVQMIARLDRGVIASTPVQTMQRPREAVEPRLPARRHWRFTIHDERWGETVAPRLRNASYPKERRAAVFSSNGEASLELPDDLEGRFAVFLEALGQHFEGGPVATVRLQVGDGEVRDLGEGEVPTWWDTKLVVPEVELPAGSKRLIVAFENDHYEADQGDRNLLLQSVMLAELPRTADETPPHVAMTYPPANQDDPHLAWMADAVVVETSDNVEITSAELILDGRETGFTAELSGQPGRLVMPLLLRSAEPGEHTVAVRARDRAGNTAQSEPVTIVIPDAAPAAPTAHARAVRMLDRFGFGPDPDELAAILTMGETAWLEDRLSRSLDETGELAAMSGSYPFFAGRNDYEVPHRVLGHLMLTPNPARARFVLWVENHFSTWIRKIQGDRKWTEHVDFSRLGVSPFDQLLEASAESPAMLSYLDQPLSLAGRINENYAREIMELHTLGVNGGYSQDDVTNLSQILTGWTVSQEGDGRSGGQGARAFTHRFDPRLSDGRATTVLGIRFEDTGLSGRYERVRLMLEVLASHPSTARFIAGKLAEHYVAVPAPEPLVDDLVRVFLETGGDMKAMLVTIAGHDAFWASQRPDRMAHTLDYGIRLCRTTRHFQPWQVGGYMSRSGYGLFDRPTPDGYPEDDAAYTDSNAMIQRWRLASELRWPLINLVPHGWRSGPGLSDEQWGQNVIDAIAVRMTGNVLSKASNEAAHRLLAATTGNRNERLQALAPFIAQLPEANLR